MQALAPKVRAQGAGRPGAGLQKGQMGAVGLVHQEQHALFPGAPCDSLQGQAAAVIVRPHQQQRAGVGGLLHGREHVLFPIQGEASLGVVRRIDALRPEAADHAGGPGGNVGASGQEQRIPPAAGRRAAWPVPPGWSPRPAKSSPAPRFWRQIFPEGGRRDPSAGEGRPWRRAPWCRIARGGCAPCGRACGNGRGFGRPSAFFQRRPKGSPPS